MNLKSTFLCAAVLVLSACASSPTKLVSTWAAPGSADFKPKKILVTCPATEKSMRLSAEVRMSQLIPNSVTSTSVFLNGEEGDKERVRARINELGIDTVVIMRPIAVDSTVEYVPPSVSTYSSGPGMYGYWGSSYYTVYDPGYTREKTVAVIETEVYAVEGEKLLWISRSNTINPESVSKAVDTIISANVESMRQQGLIGN